MTSKFEFPLVLDMSKFMEETEGVAKPKLGAKEEKRYVNELKAAMVWLDDAQQLAETVALKLLREQGGRRRAFHPYHRDRCLSNPLLRLSIYLSISLSLSLSQDPPFDSQISVALNGET